MVRHHPTISLLLITLLLSLGGCATLGLSSAESEPESAAAEYDDPIEAAARAVSLRSEIPEELALRQQELVQAGLRRRDLVIGMNMGEVVSIWGEPSDIETAGSTYSGNQRWIYPTGLTSSWSIGSYRIVYFEEGRVAGWETRQR